MSAVVIADYGNVGARRCARRIPRREIGISIGLGQEDFIRTGSMILPNMLHGHMTVCPKTQHKGRSIAMTQAEMA